MAASHLLCPYCQAPFSPSRPSAAGKPVICPRCRQIFCPAPLPQPPPLPVAGTAAAPPAPARRLPLVLGAAVLLVLGMLVGAVLMSGWGGRRPGAEPAADEGARAARGRARGAGGEGSGPLGRKYALLVGVNAYEHPRLERLQFAENDVSELAAVLEGADYEVVLLTGAAGSRNAERRPTRANIEARLKEVLGKCRRGDLLLLGFAGHGLQFERKKDAYFCPVDARPFAEETATLLSLQSVYTELARSFAGVKLLLVDACRNDPRGGRGLGGDTAPRPPSGSAALFSCRAGQRAFESDELRHGVFFHFVLEGFKGKAINDEDEVTWDHLAAYVKRQVNRQTPKIIGGGARQTPHEIKDLVGESPVLRRLPGFVRRVRPPDDRPPPPPPGKRRGPEPVTEKDLYGKWKAQFLTYEFRDNGTYYSLLEGSMPTTDVFGMRMDNRQWGSYTYKDQRDARRLD
jgi:hypothetical protein